MEQINLNNLPTSNAPRSTNLLESITREELLALRSQFSELIFLLRENNELLRNYKGIPPQDSKFPNFDVPELSEYDGSTHPYPHIKLYASKYGVYSSLDKLKILLFQKSLSGKALEWFSQMDHSKIKSWSDLTFAFLKYYEKSKVATSEPKAVSGRKRPRYEDQWEKLAPNNPYHAGKTDFSRKGKNKVEPSPNFNSVSARGYIPIYPKVIDFSRPFPFSFSQPFSTQMLPRTLQGSPIVHLPRIVIQPEDKVDDEILGTPRTLDLLKEFGETSSDPK